MSSSELKVVHGLCQGFGTLHGGAVSTIIDLATSLLASVAHKKNPAHVTLNLSANMMKSVPKGDDIYIFCYVDRIGKSVIFLGCKIYDAKGDLCYAGNHVKSFFNPNKQAIKPKL